MDSLILKVAGGLDPKAAKWIKENKEKAEKAPRIEFEVSGKKCALYMVTTAYVQLMMNGSPLERYSTDPESRYKEFSAENVAATIKAQEKHTKVMPAGEPEATEKEK